MQRVDGTVADSAVSEVVGPLQAVSGLGCLGEVVQAAALVPRTVVLAARVRA
ncbi:hypothetical protein AB0C13_25065 [Streptomyces sp. NPDC049099]|uniref:hypothetical protein n=1 Tax=Streptomyces sp. NPDC049099 TaxID=3155768 RepID=UPI0034159447